MFPKASIFSKITVGYLLLATLWLGAGDAVVSQWAAGSATVFWAGLLKDGLFVVLSGVFLVAVFRRFSGALSGSDPRLEELSAQAQIIGQAKEAILTTDRAGVITSWNAGAERLFGVKSNETVGRRLDTVFGAANCAALQQEAAETAQDRQDAPGLELPFRDKAGRDFYGLVSCSRFLDQAGAVAGSLYSVVNITGQRRSMQTLTEQLHLLALSSEIGVLLTKERDLQEMLLHCAESVVKHLDAAFVRVWVLNPEENVLELGAAAGAHPLVHGARNTRKRIPVGPDYTVGRIAVRKQPYVTNHVVDDPRICEQEWIKNEGVVAFAGQPLLIENKVVGVLGLFARHPLTDIALQSLAAIADGIALGIERKAAEQETRRIHRALRTLSACNEILIRAEEEQEFLRKICRAIVEHGGYILTWVGYALDDADKTVRPVAQAGFEEDYLASVKVSWAENEWGKGPTGKAIRKGKNVVCQNILTDPEYAPWRAEASRRGYASSVALPLLVKGETLGALNLYARDPNAFNKEELVLLKELANDVAYGITVLRARQVHGAAERELRRKTAEFEVIFKAIPDAVVFADPERRVQLVNSAFTRMFGYRLDELQGQTTEILYAHKEEYCQQGDLRYNPKAKEIFSPYEVSYRRKHGAQFPAETVGRVVTDSNGAALGYLAIIRDISERKEGEREKRRLEQQVRQAQKMEAIGTLASGIAHDFNNILAAILGYTDIARFKLPEESEAWRDLGQVVRAAARARELVKQILAFGRQAEQERRPVEIYLIVKEALKLLRASIPANIDFRLNIEPDSGTVLADPTQVHQVVMNLCTNAYHAMRDQETGVLSVSLQPVALTKEDILTLGLTVEPGNYLRLDVGDTGSGIKPEIVERIFEPYFTTKERGEGTGMGLAMVHGIVRSCAGDIAVHSEPGQGAIFHVFLPRIETTELPLEQVNSANLPQGSESIMLVDDEETVADMLHQMLQRLGYKVTVFTSSMLAAEVFAARPHDFDLLLTDMAMPQMTGEGLAKKALTVRPDIPIVLCTGFSEVMDQEKARRLGFRKIIMKPVLGGEIAKVLREVLGH